MLVRHGGGDRIRESAHAAFVLLDRVQDLAALTASGMRVP